PHLEGAPVAVVMEFLSDTECGELSIRSTPPYGKVYFYEQILQVPTYVTYDPYELSLEVRYLHQGKYILRSADQNGRFWIPELGLFLGMWQGERLEQKMNWLRWWDQEGNLLLWSSEQTEKESQRAEQESQRAEQEHQRAEMLAAKLRELGVDPDQLP
ncbi:MAG: Uma2 family endonuclease, partial [Symploca sp. SIO3E6]|nr:Uma2 family endonuclease [Caldora sp. SIO3E6]